MERLLAERERWPLWLPVFLAAGIALYFALPSEPPQWVGPLCLGLVGTAMAIMRRQRLWVLLAVAPFLTALGFGAAQMRTALVAAPILERPSGKVMVEGVISEIEPMADSSERITLEQVAADLDGPVPAKVRLRLKRATHFGVGSRIRLSALLQPPPQPVMPGAFDFARHAWFLGLGAVGSGLGTPELLTPAQSGHWLNRLRHTVFLRITLAIGGAAGGVAAALVTGQTTGIPQPVLNDYRDSGLAHLLSISGLHMSMVAGMAFFLLRGGLALIPAVALNYPIKKWAAAAALVLTGGYMLMAGAPIPAERAFLMTGLVLLAVMLDRSALSMRLVAWAAVTVLLLVPEALTGPSFQMSFAAVAALIATYEVAAKPLAQWRADHGQWYHRFGLYLVGVLLSTLVAGSATALYGAYHFNRFAVWSMLANLAAVPLTGLVVMPCALAALALMPLGLEKLALIPMGWGVEAVNLVAGLVADLPGAAITVPVLPVWGLLLFTLGGLWLMIWRRIWRLWGVLAMVAGLSGFALDQPPDVLVDGRGYAFGLRMADDSLLINRGGRILRDSWGRRAGPLSAQSWPKKGRSDDGLLACDPFGCVFRTQGKTVVLIQDDEGIAAGCTAGADVVISAVPLRGACRGTRVVIDRFDLWRRGAHALWLEDLKVVSMVSWQGKRPWSHHPVKHRKKDDDSGTTD